VEEKIIIEVCTKRERREEKREKRREEKRREEREEKRREGRTALGHSIST